ncbi:uncharacterized protein [Ptychodera flava]|uniref:uncharacterized protein n=1 Tax=Ptychodera flava TaxID=63121 RepID=UPI00396A545B
MAARCWIMAELCGSAEGMESLLCVQDMENMSLEDRQSWEGEGDLERNVSQPEYDTRDGECTEYKKGVCLQGAQCDSKHLHVVFPSAYKWDFTHMDRLHFVSHEMPAVTTEVNETIYIWLMCHPLIAADDGADTLALPAFPITEEVQETLAESGIEERKYREVLSQRVREAINPDNVMTLFTAFDEKYDVKNTAIKLLYKAARNSDLPDKERKYNPRYRQCLVRWVTMVEEYRNEELSEASLNPVVFELVEAAAFETSCVVTINMTENTKRKISVCDTTVNVQSNIEVRSVNGDGVLQVLICAENKHFPSSAKMNRILPQIACDALAIADKSPFGNGNYKTVYQVSISVSHAKQNAKMQFHVSLLKTYVCTKTLKQMSTCPIINPLEPSYMTYTHLDCPQVDSPEFLTLTYRAIKAVLLAFSGVPVDQYM